MPKLDFEKLTPSNQAVQDLRELMELTVFQNEDLARFMTFVPNVTNGKKVGFVGEMEDVGKSGGGCNPTYKSAKIAAAEKEWELGSWEIPLSLCYKDLENTIAQYCLKKGTDISDLTTSQYMSGIVEPKLSNAMMKMLWRFVWFGDKDAKNISSSGQITDGLDTKLFDTCDGFFKRLFAICTENEGQHTTIAANSEESYALQKSKLKESGVATSIFDEMLENADSRIFQHDGHAIFATKSLCDALARDIRDKYKVIMPWQTVFDGLEVGEYDGVPVVKCSIWDRFIQAYQNNTTKLNLPHRAVLCSPDNLLYGCEDTEAISDLRIWFEKKDKQNYIYSEGKLGSVIAEDNLVQVAY